MIKTSKQIEILHHFEGSVSPGTHQLGSGVERGTTAVTRQRRFVRCTKKYREKVGKWPQQQQQPTTTNNHNNNNNNTFISRHAEIFI